MFNRVLRLLLLVAAILLVAASFAWVVMRTVRSEESVAGRVKLRILHWGDKTEDEIVAGLVNEFEKQNPDIHVVRSNVGSTPQLQTKLQTMLAAGDPPDLFYLDFSAVANFASNEVLEEIEPYLEQDRDSRTADAPDLADFFPATLDAFRYDSATQSVGGGRLVGLPKDFTCVGFYYNKDLFDRAGVPYPPKDGWTWDQFVAAARAIAKLPDCYGAEFVTWESWVRMYLFTFGLDVAEPGFHRFRLTDPEVIAALERLRGWFHNENRTLLSAKTQLETSQAPFLTGKIGMAGPFGRWQVPLYRRIEKFDWDFAPLPHAAGKPPSNGVVTVAWAMAKAGRHKAESWRLMKFLLGRQGQEIVCNTGLAIPVLQSVAESPCFTNPSLEPESDSVFLAGAKQARPIECPADPRYTDSLKTTFEGIFKLGEPVAPQMEKLEQTWRQISQRTAKAPPMPWSRIELWFAIGLAGAFAATAAFWWKTRPGKLALREEAAGLALVSPWLIGFVVFCTFPIVMSFLLGFARWNPMHTLDHAEWVGLANFDELLNFDPTFRKAIRVTVWYAVLAVPTSQIAALVAAMLLSRETRTIGLFRAIWYLPSVLAGVGMAIMWKWVFHHKDGMLNSLLEPLLSKFGLHAPAWFDVDADTWGVPAFVIINLWVIGGTMMIYLAGLKGIPRDLYEAAEIDGASPLRTHRAVTLPMLSPVIFFNTIMAIIASFQIFTQVFVMTGGGPKDATQFYVFYLYKKAFDLGAMGYASAMAWVLLLIVLGLTLLITRGTRRMVYYEALK
ncbi:MAG: extracellular solute-binding protein [Planctomycetes bacterium]|nr:extracellular solute-binding protein [Planctomycetota bacterium]